MADTEKYPKGYEHTDIELKWRSTWDDTGLYRWNPEKGREETFVVDTPPPTVSGSLHVGHAYSYTQTDVMVRFQRMLGKNIFYPMGWDDNGLPTERRAQNVYNIRCEAHLPYNPDWKARKADAKSKDIEVVSRENFIEACEAITAEDELVFEGVWRKLGLSVDWRQVYTTIGSHCRRVSQYSFLDLIRKGRLYNEVSITMWDVDFQTAVSQAEIEDRETQGAFHDLRFAVEGGGEFIISTTRPELLPACIAVAAHPEDERFKALFGKKAITPLFKTPVPIVSSEHADPEKGSGILMICTFGDMADVDWWRTSGMPARQIIGQNGRLIPIRFDAEPFTSLEAPTAQAHYDQLAGLTVKQAKKRVVELLMSPDSFGPGAGPAMIGEPKALVHPVRFYEKGERPLEFIPTRQWFIRILDQKAELLAQGAKIEWHPDYMRTRFDHWVEGLNQDWCVSRQRYFGVPIPVWYPILADGRTDYDHPILPEADRLPVDPLSMAPAGYGEDQRNQPGGFRGEEDVMDTWATSSLTPQISSHWGVDETRHQKLFPADLRPQAHDIIRTWAFYTIVKAWIHHQDIPWKHAAISGFILDPDRKKMSKSKGNVMTPETLLDEHSSDVFRYWASRGRLGTDSTFDPTLFKIGRKLVIKLFNASKFVFMQLDGLGEVGEEAFAMDQVSSDLDRSWIAFLRQTIEEASLAFEQYEYTTALQKSEEGFWRFCDHYLELVKEAAYRAGSTPESRSALATLNWSLKVFLRLFAPFMPFVTEEIWSWRYRELSPSIHIASWPRGEEVASVPPPRHDAVFDMTLEVIGQVRSYKTSVQASLRTEVESLHIEGAAVYLDVIRDVLIYIRDVTFARDLPVLIENDAALEGEQHFRVDVRLVPPADEQA
jgi:valyl-tRNA synthetase